MNRSCCLVFLSLATSWSANCLAQPYSEIVVFGASLTDVGNIAVISPPFLGFSSPPSPPYFDGRFANGPIWIDVLADHLGLPRPEASETGGTNYAYGGATSGTVDNPFRAQGLLDMDDQVAEYLTDHTPTGQELFVIPAWISTNDFANEQDDPALTVRMVGSLISDLASAGAKHLLVGNSINSPRFSRPDLLRPYNDQLAIELGGQRTAHPGLTLYEFDAETAFDAIFNDPAALGIINLTDSACQDCGAGQNPNPTQIAENPNEFLFWDGASHFTAPVHEAIGSAAFQAVPEPSANALAGLALLCATCLRRNQIRKNVSASQVART